MYVNDFHQQTMVLYDSLLNDDGESPFQDEIFLYNRYSYTLGMYYNMHLYVNVLLVYDRMFLYCVFESRGHTYSDSDWHAKVEQVPCSYQQIHGILQILKSCSVA